MKHIHYALFLLGLASPSFSVDRLSLEATQSARLSEAMELGAAPSKLRHLPVVLRNDAHVFYIRWGKIYSSLKDNPFAQYIEDIVTTDGIGIEVKKKAIQYRSEELGLQQREEASWDRFSKVAKPLFVTKEMDNNPFSLYFRGLFAYYGYLFPEDEKDFSSLSHEDESKGKEIEIEIETPYKIEAAQLLNQASKNKYVRATNFMIAKSLWDDVGLTESKLERRQNKILAPHIIVLDYVKNHRHSFSTTNNDVKKIEKLISFLPGDYETLQEIYDIWAENLVKYLQSSKEIGSTLRLDIPSQTMSVLNAVVLGTSSATGLYNWIANDQTAVGVLGLVQGTAALTSIFMSGINLSSIRDLCSRASFHNLQGNWSRLTWIKLLHKEIPLNEINFQSRLVVLFILLYNTTRLLGLDESLEGIDPNSDRSIALLKKARKLILSCEPGYTKALSRVIINKNQENFLY